MSSGIRTLSLLQDSLDHDFAWRLKEIADLKIAVRSIDRFNRRTIIRAGVPLLYAHWEGFVKSAACSYIEFIGNQRLVYDDLDSCFIVIGLKAMLDQISSSRKVKKNIEIIDFLRNGLGSRAKLNHELAINTGSNLNSEIFENVCHSIGVDIAFYESRFNLIDVSLLSRRNKIAHGEFLDLEPDSYRELSDEVILLLRAFKTDVENAATLQSYKRKP